MNTISLRQAGLFTSLLIFSSKLLVLPSLLYQTNSFGAIFSLLLILCVEFLFIFLIINLKQKNPNLSVYQIFNKKIGKILTKILFFILFLFFLLKIFYILHENYSFLKQTLFSEATLFVYLLCVLPVISSMVFKGLKAMGRTVEIFYVVILVLLLISMLSWFFTLKELTFTIFMSNGFSGFLSACFDYTFCFSDFVFLIVIVDKIKFEEKQLKSFYAYVIASLVIIFLFIFTFFLAYQTTSFVKQNAIFNISQFSNYFGTLGKFNIISITSVAIILYFQLAMFLFCANLCLEKLFPFKSKAQPLIFINIILLIASLLIFSDVNNVVIFYSHYVKYLSIFVAYGITSLFLLLSTHSKNKRGVVKWKKFFLL